MMVNSYSDEVCVFNKRERKVSLYLLYFIFHISYLLHSDVIAAQTPLMRDVFAAMPDSIMPMVTKNNRLDCIDFIENNMEAKVRNVADEYVTLEALTKDYARFRTSAASVLEMKLLPLDSPPALPVREGVVTCDSERVPASQFHSAPLPHTEGQGGGSPYLLCIVTTAQTGEPNTPRRLEDSNILFRHIDWSLLPDTISLQSFITVPPVAAFLTQETEESHVASTGPDNDAFQQALRSLADFHPIRLALSPDTPTLTATLQPAYLAVEERKAISPHLQSLSFRWNGSAFVMSAKE